MYICYLDESGTPEAGDASKHFVLVGLAVLASAWKNKDRQIDVIKAAYGMEHHEVHTAWMLREYSEQKTIPNFDSLDHATRRALVIGVRAQRIAVASPKKRKALGLEYRKTDAYIHLTREERRACVQQLADLLGAWGDARIFADVQQKKSLPNKAGDFEEAFEQVVTRFNTFLKNVGGVHGLLVQDNNDTVADRLTKLMRKFHKEGTTWAKDIEYVVETPLFVDSELTSMVQLADLCGYAIRRFFDQGESDLIDRISPVFDRNAGKLVGVRHYTKGDACECKICLEHGRKPMVRRIMQT